jgi:glucose/arabinose dehydrogenase
MRIRSGLCKYLLVLVVMTAGCLHGPTFVPSAQQQIIDRSVIDSPSDTQVVMIASGLTAPTSFCIDADGTMFIADNAHREGSPHIFARKPDGSTLEIYPIGKRVPGLEFLTPGFRIYGPIGGMCLTSGKLYVTHRDADGMGAVTAFGMDGTHTTIIANLPTRGDYSVTDIAVRQSDGRLFFAIGTATNSGVVGLDNYQIGWLRKYPSVCDKSFAQLELNGYRFNSKNPNSGIGVPDIAVTAPFQPFGQSDLTTILAASDGRANGAVYSVSPTGGDLKVVAFGMHLPRGLAFSEYGKLYAVNDGMELRGTRPVKNDPDALVSIPLSGVVATDYGWPDYSADLMPISDPRFQEESLLRPSGYRRLRALIDRDASKLQVADRNLNLFGVFPSQSGAAKCALVPNQGPFKEFQGSVIVALSGDRAPFATSGYELREHFGYRVAAVDVEKKIVSDFVVNTRRKPASRLGTNVVALERPIDVKFGPDGSLYILDFGQLTVKGGKEKIVKGTGKIFKLMSVPATQPSKR